MVTLVRPDSHAEHASEKEYLSDQADRTWGVAFHVPEEDVKETLKYLDHREKGGYSRHTVSVFHTDPDDPKYVDRSFSSRGQVVDWNININSSSGRRFAWWRHPCCILPQKTMRNF